jgi:hypothetical protein
MTLGHPDNYVILCANCHYEFDNSIPAFVILPTNMKYFIDYEKRDYKSRMDAVRAGKEPLERRVPDSSAYKRAGGMYKAYGLRPGCYAFSLGSWPSSASEEREWGGCSGSYDFCS